MIGYGRVPAKIAKRIPIGLALTYVSGAISPNDVSKANYLAAQGTRHVGELSGARATAR